LASAFSRPERFLKADSRSFRFIACQRAADSVGGVVLFAPVPAYEVSDQAAHPVAAAASGRALASNLTLFENVQAGDGGLKEI